MSQVRKYWDGRFDPIRLDDRNLPAIARERLLKPKDDHAHRLLGEALAKAAKLGGYVCVQAMDGGRLGMGRMMAMEVDWS